MTRRTVQIELTSLDPQWSGVLTLTTDENGAFLNSFCSIPAINTRYDVEEWYETPVAYTDGDGYIVHYYLKEKGGA